MAPILEAPSKSWINCCQQWHNLPGTPVGLVSSQLSFEEGTVQGKKKKSGSHHTQLPFYLQNNWPWQFPHSSRLGTTNAAGSCLLMERAGSGSNWLGKDFFQKTVLLGGFRKAGTSPHGLKPATQACCQKVTRTRNSHGVHNTEVWASSHPAGLPHSSANAGESSQAGGLALRGGYCS